MNETLYAVICALPAIIMSLVLAFEIRDRRKHESYMAEASAYEERLTAALQTPEGSPERCQLIEEFRADQSDAQFQQTINQAFNNSLYE